MACAESLFNSTLLAMRKLNSCFVLDLELSARKKRLALDLEVSFERRFLSLQRPLVVCNRSLFELGPGYS